MDSLASLLSGAEMDEMWIPKKPKTYPHFDAPISLARAAKYVADEEKVRKHTFYPFIRYTQHWTKYAPRGEKGETKDRVIRYAARMDSYIFSYYRFLLSEKYEEQLAANGLENSVLAYRRIVRSDGRGKSNIDHAKESFDTIKSHGNCFVVAMDIKGFFDHLDHKKLKQIWCEAIDKTRLPPDHFAVFKAITRFADVEKLSAYERLGHFGEKRRDAAGRSIKGYLTSRQEFRNSPQLCSASTFRQKISGEGTLSSIIEVNKKSYGIPQGAPLSDLLANMYLIEFDKKMLNLMHSMSGSYLRYSDDILLIMPTTKNTARSTSTYAADLIRQFGARLELSSKKTMMFQFQRNGNQLSASQIAREKEDSPSIQLNKDLEYLGFRFDGNRVFIRDSTLSNLNRKMVKSGRRSATAHVKRYPGKSLSELVDLYNFEDFHRRFGRVRDFHEQSDDFRKWTFWTYVRRAADIFEDDGHRIRRQFRNFTKSADQLLEAEIERALIRRKKVRR